MAREAIDVNGRELPEALVLALDSGVWANPVDPSILATVFPDERDAPFHPRFYLLEEMRGMSQPELIGPEYHGVVPDDLDPGASVWIGEIAFDRPFALDYRLTPPCVRFLTIPGRWVRIADSADDLLARLGKV